MNWQKEISKLGYMDIVAIQQLTNLRKQQLNQLESSVYMIGVKHEGETRFLLHSGDWGNFNDPQVQVFPCFAMAEYVRQEQNAPAGVIKIPKKEFKHLPCFLSHVKLRLVDTEGNFVV